jgi:hypothetical protein
MANVSLTVIGLEELRSTTQAFPKRLTSALKPAVKDTALEVRERARNKARVFATDGFYPAGIVHEMGPGGLEATVTTRATTSASIERGRHPGELVKFGLILKWVQRRGIVRGINITTRKTVRLSKKGRAAVSSDEYAVVREIISAIQARGTRPHPHLIPAAQESEIGWKRRILDSVAAAMRTVKGA